MGRWLGPPQLNLGAEEPALMLRGRSDGPGVSPPRELVPLVVDLSTLPCVTLNSGGCDPTPIIPEKSHRF